MHIPLSRHEIAEFLETELSVIDQLWTTGKLKRSYYDAIRPIEDLAQSSIFDVTEYALASDILAIRIPQADAAMWVLYLCELCEQDSWNSLQIKDRAAKIFAYAANDGLVSINDEKAATVATTLIATHTALLNICNTENAHLCVAAKLK